MTEARYIDLVDARDFRTLFIDELGWNNPDQPNLHLEVEDDTYTLTQIAGYKGLRIWHCAAMPPRKTQRVLDVLVGKDNHERLIIFTNETRQEWRWPRRAQLSGTNAKLLIHEHAVGQPNSHLAQRLKAIELDFDEDLSLVALLEKMREAFDVEAETASVQAARLMGTLYADLDSLNVSEHDATLLLARLLFLFFGDDADMWQPGLFHHYIRDHTIATTLHTGLQSLFDILDTPEDERKPSIDEPYTSFRYINGGLYADPLVVPALTPAFRGALLEACEFDWAIISPAIFGSMFQTVKSKVARRSGGEHYTSEENILKTIRPLFLDEYTSRFGSAWNDKTQLTKLHNELGSLRFLDPACGCGNFLIVSYRELRALELDILKRRRDLDLVDGLHTGGVNKSQLSLDVSADIQVTLDHFYGIELADWPARIAETAMLLVDHLANQRMAQEFGYSPDRLPIAIAPTIYIGNALLTDWAQVLSPTDNVVVLGNPPFIGQRWRQAERSAELKSVWGGQFQGNLDYVTGWFKKAVEYYGGYSGRWAFVATNSICQGEPVAALWRPILEAGWRCRFAHRSFQWTSEASEKAAVHVSIVGFDKAKTNPKPVLWVYPEGGHGRPSKTTATNINPFLVDGHNVLIGRRSKPLSIDLPPAGKGSYPTDGGHLIVEQEDYSEVIADPIAAKYVRPYVGARQLLHDEPRWCLWLKHMTASDRLKSRVLGERIEAVKQVRLKSTKTATREKAATPHLFDEDHQPRVPYLAIPVHSSENRLYLPVKRYPADVIVYAANFAVEDPEGFALAVLSSSMFITWLRTVGGRIKSDLRLSNTYVYNNFPLPSVTATARRSIIAAARPILVARDAHPSLSLADLYNPLTMPAALAVAHAALDQAVNSVFKPGDASTEAGRQKTLFRSYATLVGH